MRVRYLGSRPLRLHYAAPTWGAVAAATALENPAQSLEESSYGSDETMIQTMMVIINSHSSFRRTNLRLQYCQSFLRDLYR